MPAVFYSRLGREKKGKKVYQNSSDDVFLMKVVVKVIVPLLGVTFFFWGLIDGPFGLSIVGLVGIAAALIYGRLPKDYEFFGPKRGR